MNTQLRCVSFSILETGRFPFRGLRVTSRDRRVRYVPQSTARAPVGVGRPPYLHRSLRLPSDGPDLIG